jgi:hypothetical protein
LGQLSPTQSWPRLQAYLRHHIALAQYFARLVEQDARFEVAAPQRFGLVCFRLAGVPREANVRLLEAVNASGGCWARSQGRSGCLVAWLRGACSGERCQRRGCRGAKGGGDCAACGNRCASCSAAERRRWLSGCGCPAPCCPAGEAFLIHTELGGQYTLRLAVGAATTQKRHIDQAWQLLSEAATQVLAD